MREVPAEYGSPVELTRPFAFSEQLRPVPSGIDPLPFVDFFLLALFGLFLLQPLLFSPGVSVEVPTAGPAPLAGVHADAVVTLQEDRLLTEQGSFPAAEAAVPLERLRADLPADRTVTLLLVADRTLSLASLQDLIEAATEAGFARVQVAARPGEPDPSLGGPP